MYVAVKGGEQAILNSYRLLEAYRRGDAGTPELSVAQIAGQMPLAVARVMAEGALYDPQLAALAIKQAAGDLTEAVFLLRAYRTTLPRLGASEPIDTGAMHLQRRISATFKDVPGGQVLGPTYDYTQRLLDFALLADGRAPEPLPEADEGVAPAMPRITDLLRDEALLEPDAAPAGDPEPADLTRQPLELPAPRSARLQNLARADEGFLLSMGYSTQRGYGNSHPFVAEIRYGTLEVEMHVEELGFAVTVGSLEVTECQMVNQFAGQAGEPPCFTRGYGLVFGYGERKAMAMALVDRAMRAAELGEPADAPANDQEFVLYHSDNVEASGFVQHLKLPHYVDFQTNLELLRRMRADLPPQAAGSLQRQADQPGAPRTGTADAGADAPPHDEALAS